MIALKRILVPADFSKPCEVAVNYAKALADAFHESLHVLHVIQDPFVHGFSPGPYVAAPPGYREELEKLAQDQLRGLLTDSERSRFSAILVKKWGSPFLEIIRYAKSENVDLIVMGTHGRGPVAHMLLGSVAEKVVRKAPCPVLTVRHPEHEFVMP